MLNLVRFYQLYQHLFCELAKLQNETVGCYLLNVNCKVEFVRSAIDGLLEREIY